jgi:outer membrane protein assembly factor BamB/tetratricopeptide (TPR) repeat protein
VPGQLQPEFPYFADYDKVRGRDVLVVTDGTRVVAVNPQKVTSTNAAAGVMWRFPPQPLKRQYGAGRGMEYMQTTSPMIGATIHENHVYVTLFSEKRAVQNQNPNQQDFFEGPQQLACIDAISGKLVWNTDDGRLHDKLKKLEFFDRNWAFATPPLVRGDNVYIGICTSPIGEPESRVVCFDRMTGEIRWHTFLASVTGGVGRWWGGGGRWVTYLTTLVEEGGVIYAHSNLGATAALHAVSGNVLWLSRYPRQGQRVDQWRGDQGATFIRYASQPVIHRGRIYCLPQDAYEMQVFSIADGAKIPFPSAPPGAGQRDLTWRNITQLVGTMEDWMILGGTESYVVNLVDRVGTDGKVRTFAGRAYSLPRSNVSRCGRGLIDGETIYFPTCEETTGTLSIYHGLGSFKNLDQTKWQEVGEYGNLLVAGDYLVVTTGSKAMVFTDVETIRKEFIQRLTQSPPSAQAFLEHGDIMRQNEKLVEAAESYLKFIEAAHGDPNFEKKVLDVKTELHDIYLKRGNEAIASTDARQHETAIDYFRAAKGFSFNEATFAEATRRLAESYEKVASAKADPAAKKELARKAVEEYQEIVERSRESYYKPENGDLIQKVWKHAATRISELGKMYGPEVLEPVERAAKEEFDRLAAQGGDALRKVVDHYPQTKAAMEAYRRMAADHVKAANWKKVVAVLREFKEKHPDQWTLELQRTVTEALEKLGDWRRLWDELKKLADQFGTQMVKEGEQEISIKAIAERKQSEIQGRLVDEQAVLADPLTKLTTMEGAASGGGRFEIATGAVPLTVTGQAPPGYTADHELFVRGSSVELWDLKKKERVWTALHPGGFLGLAYEDVKGGADPGVRVVELQSQSPAEKAGLQGGDIVLIANGISINAVNFDDVVCAATGPIKLQWMRENKAMEGVVERIAWPSNVRPAVMGAAFTRDYSLAVAWEDLVGSIDMRTGQCSWTFRGVRDRFTLHRVGTADGRLLLHEHYRAQDRLRSPFRSLSSQMVQEQGALQYDDSYARLIVLDDSTGEVSWAKSFPFDPSTPAQHKVSFVTPPTGDKVGILVDSFVQNVRSFEIVLLSLADGKTLPGYKMPGNVLSTSVDVERGLVYYVEGNNRMLKCVNFGGGQAPKLPDISLQRYLDPNSVMAGVVAGREYVAVFIPPWQAGAAQKVVVFSLKTGQEHATLVLPDERSLPLQRVNIGALGDDGTLYVYNLPKSKVGNAGGSDRRAFLSAYKIAAEEPKIAILWDAPAPFLPAGSNFELFIQPLENLVILYAARGSRPTETSDAPQALVYGRKDGGYLRQEFAELATTPPDARPLLVRRGRLFAQTKSGLDIYGNP